MFDVIGLNPKRVELNTLPPSFRETNKMPVKKSARGVVRFEIYKGKPDSHKGRIRLWR